MKEGKKSKLNCIKGYSNENFMQCGRNNRKELLHGIFGSNKEPVCHRSVRKDLNVAANEDFLHKGNRYYRRGWGVRTGTHQSENHRERGKMHFC